MESEKECKNCACGCEDDNDMCVQCLHPEYDGICSCKSKKPVSGRIPVNDRFELSKEDEMKIKIAANSTFGTMSPEEKLLLQEKKFMIKKNMQEMDINQESVRKMREELVPVFQKQEDLFSQLNATVTKLQHLVLAVGGTNHEIGLDIIKLFNKTYMPYAKEKCRNLALLDDINKEIDREFEKKPQRLERAERAVKTPIESRYGKSENHNVVYEKIANKEPKNIIEKIIDEKKNVPTKEETQKRVDDMFSRAMPKCERTVNNDGTPTENHSGYIQSNSFVRNDKGFVKYGEIKKHESYEKFKKSVEKLMDLMDKDENSEDTAQTIDEFINDSETFLKESNKNFDIETDEEIKKIKSFIKDSAEKILEKRK